MPDIETPEPQPSAETDSELLLEFVRSRTEQAFAELVERHAGWVQGVALRSLEDRELAQEVTQNVFILLAQKASRVRPETLGPWLHRVMVLECRNARRRERTRLRTLAALTQQTDHMKPDNSPADAEWQTVLPVLDHAVNALPEPERAVVVQRFLQQKSWKEIGASLGRSEDSARMALGPALERMQRVLRKRGVTLPVASIATALSFSNEFTGTVSAALLTKVALTRSLVRPVVPWWRSGAGAGLSTAACLVLGTLAGYQFSAPANPLVAETHPARSGVGQDAESSGRFAAGGNGFDLEAVLDGLRALKPSGNDVEAVVRLRAALLKMPKDAVQQVLGAIRKRRWGTDSASVAAAFFHRWAVLDVEAAWAAFRDPDFLGAASTTVRAILMGTKTDDPSAFVRLINSLPDTEFYQSEAIAATRRYLGSLPFDTVVPLLGTLNSPFRRNALIRSLLERPLTPPELSRIAPMACGLHPLEATTTIALLSMQWYQKDRESFQQWATELPSASPQHWAAVMGEARAVSEVDPAAACKLLEGVPWTWVAQSSLEDMVKKWMSVDRTAASQWIAANRMIPATNRERLLPGSVEKEDGP